MTSFSLPNHEIKAGTKHNDSKYDITHQLLFQTPLFEIHIDDIDNRELEKNIYKLKDKSEDKNVFVGSDRGGWHCQLQSSQPNTQYDPIDDTFVPVIDKLPDILYNLPFDPKVGVIDDMTIWTIINGKGSYNITHNHPNCDLAGVYYVKVPKGECGNISFQDPRPALFGNTFMVERYGGMAVTRYPVEGNMYLFPSHLMHDVGMNNVDEDRIAISFNLRVR
tara:strand:+ start:68 stop:730 length:663 start_codon:yes stop_codon:yes gene_type:complete